MAYLKNFAVKSIVFLVLLINVENFARAESLKIGVIIPMSGPVATFGDAVKNAIELAQAENDQSTRDKIKFIYEDSQYDGKLAISAFNKLVTSDKVNLIYAWGTTPAIALAPLADQSKIPLITLSGAEEVAGNHPFVIDFIVRISDFSKATMDYARSKGIKKIGIIKMETQYIEALLKGIEEDLLPEENIKTIVSFSPDNNIDFNPVVAKLKNSLAKKEFDAIGVFVGTGPLSTLYQKMSQYGIQVPTLGTDYLGDEVEMKKAGKSAIGSFYATPKVSEDFLKNYSGKFGTTAISFAANAYDFAKLVYQNFKDTKVTPTSTLILDRFENVKNYKGACGEYVFVNEDPRFFKHAGKRFKSEIAIKEIVEGGSAREMEFLRQ